MRFRSPDHMIEEIRFLKEKLGVVSISIRDDTFTVHKQRVIDFCRRLIDSRLDIMWNCQSRVNAIDEERLAWMRRAGCDHIQYGVESGSPRLLEKLAKDITVDEIRAAAAATRKVGLSLSIYLISGIPDETDEDFAATRDLVREIRPHDGLVAPLAVFPGTRLYEEMKASGKIDDGYWIRQRRDTLYLMEGPPARRSFKRLTALCERVGRSAPYGRVELEAHKKLLPGSFATWLSSGEAYEALGDPGSALADYHEALEFSPGNVWVLARIGRLLIRSGDSAGARIYVRQALRAVPRSRLVGELELQAARVRHPRADA